MPLFEEKKPDFLQHGVPARLIPPVADTSKEGRITSSLLACLVSVDEFAHSLLGSVGKRVGKTSKIECFTEVVFPSKNKSDKKLRPDGLIVVTTGKKQWKALIEAKIGKSELETKQVEAYLDLARENKADAVITISNQFAATPSHHPTEVNKQKTRSVDLYHWSWMHLLTEAIMWIKYHGVSDPDQAFILTELVRYMQHDKSGVTDFTRMNSTWKTVCMNIRNGISPKKHDADTLDSIASWHQLVRNISLDLSLATGTSVVVYLSRSHTNDATKRLHDDAAELCDRHQLEAEFDVPNAASRVCLLADVPSHSVHVSMRLKAPEERATAKGRINWFVGQLKRADKEALQNEQLFIRAIWPGRTKDTLAKLKTILDEGPDCLLPENSALKPVAFEAVISNEMGARFRGSGTFIQDTAQLVKVFYDQVGQHLKGWTPPAPKMKTKDTNPLDRTEDKQSPPDTKKGAA